MSEMYARIGSRRQYCAAYSRLGSALTCCFLGIPAVAQEMLSDMATTLDTIEVTAQFRIQNIQDTPIAISAINSEMMQARGQLSVLDIAGSAPDVTIKPMADTARYPLLAGWVGGHGLITRAGFWTVRRQPL